MPKRHRALRAYAARTVSLDTCSLNLTLFSLPALDGLVLRYDATQVRGHPQIVNLLGVCNTSSSVTEYFGDDVEALLKRSRGQALPISKVLPMALDAARGLQALHEAPGGPIVHFDIKSQNLLLDEEGRLKINDLNMCRFLAMDDEGHTCPFKTPGQEAREGWRSPENMAGEVRPLNSSNPYGLGTQQLHGSPGYLRQSRKL